MTQCVLRTMFPMPKDVPLSKSLFSKPSLLCSIATTTRRQHQELLCFITTIRRLLKQQVYKWGFKEVTMKLAPTKTPTMRKMYIIFFLHCLFRCFINSQFCAMKYLVMLYSFLWRWRQVLELGAIAKVANLQCKMNNK